jgi:hypothetical protein
LARGLLLVLQVQQLLVVLQPVQVFVLCLVLEH